MKPAVFIRFIFERRGSLDEGDDDFPMWVIGVAVGGVVAIIVIAVVFVKCRSSNRH